MKKEILIAENLKFRLSQKKESLKGDIDAVIATYEAENGISLDEAQKEAVKVALGNKVAIITGGPGTGKTSVLKCIIYCIKTLSPTALLTLLSPTGKAAKRMTEATNVFATTILGGLGYNPAVKETTAFLTSDYVFIDESSMVDIDTMYELVTNISPKTSIIFIGDENQLPSVKEGAVLRDMIVSGVVPKVLLTKTFRQAEGSVLLENIAIIKGGGHELLKRGTDFTKKVNRRNLIKDYVDACKQWGKDNVCVLTPTHRVGKYSSDALNAQLQALNTSEVKIADAKGRMFKLGDPVIQIVNTELASNGEVGKIVSIGEKAAYIAFDEDRVIRYPQKYLWQLDLAYALSIHKSQGSEYKCVLVLCNKGGNMDLNMLYTAVTRAKKCCILYGSDNDIIDACQIESTWLRETHLAEYLTA